MKNLKLREEFNTEIINEMAKGWPVGSVVKFNTRFDAPPSNRYVSKSEYRRGWQRWIPSQPSDVSGGSMYMEITESGKMWLIGKILFVNCTGEVETGMVRIHTDYAEKPTSEFKILQDNQDVIKGWMGKSFYLEGDEDGILSVKGDTKKVSEGEYIVKSMNFKLTDLFEEPVFFVVPKGSIDVTKGFSVKLSVIDKLPSSLSKEQLEVINDWISKQIGTDVTFESGIFSIATFSINAQRDEKKGLKKYFSAGPFATIKDAEDVLEEIKKLKFSHFDVSTLKVSRDYSMVQFTLEEIVSFCRANGVDVSIKKLMELKKGAVTGKRYGL
jgi:hypothetical protein